MRAALLGMWRLCADDFSVSSAALRAEVNRDGERLVSVSALQRVGLRVARGQAFGCSPSGWSELDDDLEYTYSRGAFIVRRQQSATGLYDIVTGERVSNTTPAKARSTDIFSDRDPNPPAHVLAKSEAKLSAGRSIAPPREASEAMTASETHLPKPRRFKWLDGKGSWWYAYRRQRHVFACPCCGKESERGPGSYGPDEIRHDADCPRFPSRLQQEEAEAASKREAKAAAREKAEQARDALAPFAEAAVTDDDRLNLDANAVTAVADRLSRLELVELDLKYKHQEVEGLKRSCEATRRELRAVREGEAELERRARAAEARVAKVERAAGQAAVAALLESGLRADLEAARDELRRALEIIDHIAPRPWEAAPDPSDGPFTGLDPEELDDSEWVVADANDNTVDRSFGSNVQSNGEWARGWVAEVNALGTCLEPVAPTSEGPKD